MTYSVILMSFQTFSSINHGQTYNSIKEWSLEFNQNFTLTYVNYMVPYTQRSAVGRPGNITEILRLNFKVLHSNKIHNKYCIISRSAFIKFYVVTRHVVAV